MKSDDLVKEFMECIIEVRKMMDQGSISQEAGAISIESYMQAIELDKATIKNEALLKEYEETVELLRRIREGLLIGLQIGANVAAGRYDAAITQGVSLILQQIN